MKSRLTVVIDAGIIKAVKILAVKQGKTTSELVEEALKKYIEEVEKAE